MTQRPPTEALEGAPLLGWPPSPEPDLELEASLVALSVPSPSQLLRLKVEEQLLEAESGGQGGCSPNGPQVLRDSLEVWETGEAVHLDNALQKH